MWVSQFFPTEGYKSYLISTIVDQSRLFRNCLGYKSYLISTIVDGEVDTGGDTLAISLI